MLHFLKFWLTLELIGLAAWPLAWRLLRGLPDRGLAFAKALGLLLTGYVLWLGASLGLLRNDLGGSVLALLLMLGFSLSLGRPRQALAHLRTHWRHALGIETLFLLAMAGWAIIRAHNPDISGTEKPMEIAFINGVFNSTTFPPQDPWLAGYGISYYYFGYVLLAMLARFSGIATTITFNLGLAAIFAFAITQSFALGHALVVGDNEMPGSQRLGWLYGLLAGAMVTLMGNMEVLLEVLHARGWLSSSLLTYFDIKNLAQAKSTGHFMPSADGWWWWRASRTIHDYNFAHTAPQEVIDEFPQFSLILGDMHPHLLAIPFALLLMALALSLLVAPTPTSPETKKNKKKKENWQTAWRTVIATFGLNGWGLPLTSLLVGAMGFLNTWDFPIYVFLLTTTYALARQRQGLRIGKTFWREITVTFLSLIAAGIALYLPFYLSFSSQAGGIVPNVVNPTRFVQYLLMFGPFIVALSLMLLVAFQKTRPQRNTLSRWLLITWLTPLLFLALAILIILLRPELRHLVASLLGDDPSHLLPQIAQRRLSNPFTWLIVGALLASSITLLIQQLMPQAQNDTSHQQNESFNFALILFGTGLLLTYAVEFVYLRDQFGTRMNTVFKFYFQAWLLMAIASAYALYYLQSRSRGLLKGAGMSLILALVAIGMLYPALAIPSRANNFRTPATLDGAAFIQNYRPDEYAIIQWLQTNAAPDAVLVEAPGRSYSEDNFIAAFTGRPTVLGWSGHEAQWRGNYDEQGRREPLIGAIYKNQSPERTRQSVQEFGIRYLIVGPHEREVYKISPNIEHNYQKLWQPILQQGPYTLYRWKGDVR